MTLAAILIVIGRVILGGFFVIAAIRNGRRFEERKLMATNYGRTLPPAAIALGFAMQLLGGLLVLVNFWPAVGALILIAFLILATSLFHNPLMFKGKERDPHIYFMLVNIGLTGYCLLVIGISL